ncbi:uncharacterized protein [Panulirus ornatus]|uniref:uncharacterized protein n=1 Tax=Panulirus ornatus TaxID=150431 RepID=UPI003A8AB3D9
MRSLPLHVVCWMVMALTSDVGSREMIHYRVSCSLGADCLQLVDPVAEKDIQTMDPVKKEGIYPMDSVEEEDVQRVSPVEYEDTEQVNPVKDDGIQPLESLDKMSARALEKESSHVVAPSEHEVTEVLSQMKDQLVSSTDDIFSNLVDLRDEEPTSTDGSLAHQDTKISSDLTNNLDGHLHSRASGENQIVDSVAVDAINTIVKSHLSECHLVRFTSRRHSPTVFQGLSRLAATEQPAIDVDGESLFSQEQPLRDHLRQGLWGKASHTCRALLLYLLTNDYSLAFRFLEWSGVWQQREMRMVVVGGPAAVAEVVLLHPSLRNTLHALYLSLHQELTAQHHHTSRSNLTLATILKKRVQHVPEGRASVWVYRRCLFCNNSEAGVQLLHQWNLDQGVPEGASLFTGTILTFEYFKDWLTRNLI